MYSNRIAVAPIQPKTSLYFSNGTGRDSYIAFNNGGIIRDVKLTELRKELRPASATRLPKPRLDAKVIHYHSDGTGRDKYITINEGGLTSGHGSSRGFWNSLRSYERVKTPIEPRRDYFDWAQKQFSVKDIGFERNRSMLVKTVVERLSTPKGRGRGSKLESPNKRRNMFTVGNGERYDPDLLPETQFSPIKSSPIKSSPIKKVQINLGEKAYSQTPKYGFGLQNYASPQY